MMQKLIKQVPNLVKIIKLFDIFGQQVSLNINRERYYKTVIGGLSSVFIIFVLVTIFQSNIFGFFRKEKVSFSRETQFSANPGLIIMNTSNYMAAFSIEQSDYLGNPLFNISVEQRLYYRDIVGNQQKQSMTLELEPCTLDHFSILLKESSTNFTQEYETLNLKKWLCPKKDFAFNLSGTFTSPEFSFIRITVSSCIQGQGYKKWMPTCATDEDRLKKLTAEGSFKLQIYQVNSVVNPDQSDQYYQSYLDGEMFFTFVPKKLSRQTNLYYRNYQFQNDESLLPIKDVNQKDLIVRQSVDYRDLTELGSDNGDNFAIVYLRRSQFSEYITRRYMKIDELLSFLGGFLQIMIVGFGLLVIFYNKLSMQIELLNKLYNFSKKQDPNNNQDMIIQSKQTLQNDFAFSKLLYYLIKIFERKKLALDIKSLIHYLSDGYFFKDKQWSYFKKAIEQVNKDLDIQEILHQLQHITKLKTLLLNNKQIVLFNLTPKPTLCGEKPQTAYSILTLEQQDDNMQIERIKQEIVVDLYNAWLEIKTDSSNNPCKLEINQKLLEDLGTDTQEILENFQNTQKNMLDQIEKPTFNKEL